MRGSKGVRTGQSAARSGLDSDYFATFVKAIDGPVVLVGHSYGGAVITQASTDLDNVVGLIYLAAFGLNVGDNAGSGGELFPVPLATNSHPTSTSHVC